MWTDPGLKNGISVRELISACLLYTSPSPRDDYDRVFPDELRVSSFPDRVPTLRLDSGIVSLPRLRWVKGVCVPRSNLPPALSAQ